MKKVKKKTKKKLKKIITIAVILIIILISIFAIIKIFNKINDRKKTLSPNDKEEVIKKPVEKKKVSIIDETSKSRPYAIMINTHNGALPQAGLQNAYLVYELVVEGGITRMMALFKDKDIDKIGSVRSARTQYLGYVYENDAIYFHAGGALDAVNQMRNEGINNISVDGPYGFRDTSLNRAWEHKLFTSTSLMQKAISDRGFRTTTDLPNLFKYQAEPLDLGKYEDKQVANNISIKYSYYRTSEYSYDENSKTYLRSMNGKPNTDLVTGDQYKVKNIIAYPVRYTTYGGEYQRLDNIGSGEGYYFTEGYAIPITWQKDNEQSQTKYKIKSTNEDLILNDGNTYIQIYPNRETINIS